MQPESTQIHIPPQKHTGLVMLHSKLLIKCSGAIGICKGIINKIPACGYRSNCKFLIQGPNLKKFPEILSRTVWV